jgi:hypothetical protein
MSTKRASKTSRGSTAVKLDKALWEKAKRHGMRAANKRRIEEGLEPVWSARAAQLAVQYYKAHGGRYEGKKTGKESLSRWTREQWQTRPGTAPVAFRSGSRAATSPTTARYLPKAAWARLSAAEQRATDQKKRRACKGDEGSCFVPNTRRAERAGARVRSRSRAGRSSGEARDVLVIVHLSSMASFAFEEGSEAADELLSSIAMTAREFPSVVVLDQGWDDRWARKAQREVREAAPGAVWIEHDEERDGWSELRRALPALLAEMRAGRVFLAGLWYGKKSGCVREVETILSRHFKVALVEDAIAFES